MKRTITSAALAILFLMCHSLSFAALNQYTGNWKNTDPNTSGITTLFITGNANALKVRAWGKCQPKDCDWGTVSAYAYAPNVSLPVELNAQALSAIYTTGFSQTLLIVTATGNDIIQAKVFTRFTDNSNRNNYTATYTLKREPEQAPKPGTGPVTTPALKEDCLNFNPATTNVRNIDGRWKVVDGNHWLFDFGDKRAEALQALKIIKYYRMNQSCFVGRPDPSFRYLLVNGKAPQGSMTGEDCVSFNPNTTEVRNIEGRWKVVDGNHWLFDFGDKEEEARAALAIIKKYGFTRSCFVGRPAPSFRYLKK